MFREKHGSSVLLAKIVGAKCPCFAFFYTSTQSISLAVVQKTSGKGAGLPAQERAVYSGKEMVKELDNNQKPFVHVSVLLEEVLEGLKINPIYKIGIK